MENSLSNLASQHIFTEWSKDDRIVEIDIRKIKLKSVYKLSQSEEHFEILNHPVIASFLRWKWQAVYMPYWSNMLLILSFAMVMTSYISLRYYNGYRKENDNIGFRWFGIIILTLLVLREVIQFVSDRKRFFTTRKWTNFQEFWMIAFSANILSYNIDESDIANTEVLGRRR